LKPPAEGPSGVDNYWVAIDVAAIALGVGIKHAYKLARRDKWRATPGKRDRGFLMADIRTTRLKMNGRTND
jgi:hypothetical protein